MEAETKETNTEARVWKQDHNVLDWRRLALDNAVFQQPEAAS